MARLSSSGGSPAQTATRSTSLCPSTAPPSAPDPASQAATRSSPSSSRSRPVAARPHASTSSPGPATGPARGIPASGYPASMTTHVTNGDIVVDLLRRAGLATDALAWADVLHEGPVPGGLDDGGLRRVRAEFLAGADGADAAEVRRRFEERDRALAAGRDGEYLLWFEADLYDQLQLAQIQAGQRVLRGEADHVALNGIDRWVGGVYLRGPESPWRWDEGTESIQPT